MTCQPDEIIVAPAFVREMRNHRKSCPSVDEVVVDCLKGEIGPDPKNAGWAIPGWHGRVFKIRLPNPDQNCGKSKGFRLIYEWDSEVKRLYLLRIYTHQQMEDIPAKEIRKARDEATSL